MRLITLLAAMLLPLAVAAQPPRVVTDIAPVHSLVASVTRGISAPEVLLPPGASPHGYALRPSEARMLAQADVLIWIGRDFTPWLDGSVQTLAANARHLSLLEVKGTLLLEYRGAGHIDHDAQEHGGQAVDGVKLTLSDEHDHADEKPIASGGKVGTVLRDENGRDNFVRDSELHAWLDPENAKTWLDAIAMLLSEIDPENRIAYEANALLAKQEIDEASSMLRAVLGPVQEKRFIVLHDAYHYFENRFGVTSVAAFLPNDGAAASAGHVRSISRILADGGISCVFIEPQMPATLARTLSSEHGVLTGVLDPLGDTLERGPGLYEKLILNLGMGLRDCLVS
ncbi:MAG: zinc ABC transporter substrate-binding protein [Pseudomonadota bacterium]